MLITDLPHTQSSIISMLCADADLMKIDNANVETILNIVAQEWGLKGSDLLKKQGRSVFVSLDNLLNTSLESIGD